MGTRYDARDSVFDWDYHMRLAELVGWTPTLGPTIGDWCACCMYSTVQYIQLGGKECSITVK